MEGANTSLRRVQVHDDKFSADESAALLHAIFPECPDISGMKPVPPFGAVLRSLRDSNGTAAPSNYQPLIDPVH